MTIRAKFRCSHAVVTEYPGMESKSKQFHFSAIYGKDGENALFAKATPSGNLVITVDEGTAAFTEWQPGKEYYLDFNEVSKSGS